MNYTIIPVTPYQQNCTLLVCPKTTKAAIVDPGGDIELILAALKQQQATAEKILLTHGHLDHVGASAELASLLNIPIEGPQQEDQFWIEALAEQCELFGFPPVASFSPNRWLNQGDEVSFGAQQLQVLHCPGHTPGHIVFFHPVEKLALVGDVLFKGSIGRTDFPRGDLQTLLSSIREQLWPLGGEVAFIPGHGPMSTIAEEMRSNPFVGAPAT